MIVPLHPQYNSKPRIHRGFPLPGKNIVDTSLTRPQAVLFHNKRFPANEIALSASWRVIVAGWMPALFMESLFKTIQSTFVAKLGVMPLSGYWIDFPAAYPYRAMVNEIPVD
jgi:hypothetical protein